MAFFPTLRSLVLVALMMAVSKVTLAAPGLVDDKERDFSVAGKEASAVTSDDFKSSVFQGFNVQAIRTTLAVNDSTSPGGFGVAINQGSFPILNFAGVSVATTIFNKDGQNPWHVHPRGHELLTVIQGGPLECQLVDTANKLYTFTLNLGDTGFFPQGLMHTQQNKGTGTTITMAAFNSANPGTQRIVPALFAGSADSVSISMNNAVTPANVRQIAAKVIPGLPIKKSSSPYPSGR